MNKILLSVLFLTSFVLRAQQNFVINGTVGKTGKPAKIFLSYSESGTQKADSAELKDGSFSFKGKTDVITQAVLVLDYKGAGIRNLNRKSKIDVLPLYLVDGTTQVYSPDSLSKATISGTKINEDGQRFSALLKPVNSQIIALNTEYETAAPEKKTSEEFSSGLQKRYNDLLVERNTIYRNFIAKHPDSYISFIALQSLASTNPEAAEIEPLFNSLSANIKNSKEATKFKATLQATQRTSIGATAMDFMQPDPNGRLVKLSSFRGKYVLLDFWASWCGPCRQENPNVVKAYNTYKNKNFTVLGVSLDKESAKEAWMKAIATDKLTWTHVSDLKFWNNEAAVQYGVRSIPQNFLIDPDGKIIGKNLRGEELQSFLANVLK